MAKRRANADARGAAGASVAKRQKIESEPLTSRFPDGCSIWVWGEGDFGQLGLGVDRLDPRMRPTPMTSDADAAVPGVSEVVAMAAGGMHTMAIQKSGSVMSWGVNDERALGREADAEGGACPGSVDNLPENVVSVSCGDSHTLFLSEHGEVFGCGTFREDGPMGFSPGVRIQEGIAAVAVGDAKSGDRVVKVASGADHAVMLTSRGKVYSVGYGGHGQLGRCGSRFGSTKRKLDAYLIPGAVKMPSGAGKVVDVICGSFNTVFLTEKGKVYGCGLNNYGQLGVDGDGKGILYSPTEIKALAGRKVTSIACGQHHTLAVVEAASGGKKELLSFGRAAFGRLGRTVDMEGGDAAVSTPGAVTFEEDAGEPITVAAGLAVSAAIMSTGSMYVWGCGENYLHAKGDDDSDEPAPRRVKETKRWNGHRVVDIGFGGQHAVILCQPK